MRYLNLAGYVAIPVAFLFHFLFHGRSWEPAATFILAGLSILPLARLMGEATEHLAEQTGPTWGGLLNATFGNAAELIIGIVAIHRGLNDMVKASLTGSILGNLLLVSGAAMVVGGWKREKQTFSRHAAETNGGMLALAVAAMLFPAIFHFTATNLHDRQIVQHEYGISVGVSAILIAVYALGLFFTLRTHKHVFTPPPTPEDVPAYTAKGQSWTVRRSVLVLLGTSVGVAVVAELLVGSAEQVADRAGWNHVFVGVILLAVIGNAAEHSTAILLARRNDMDTAMTICHQSSLQIALFATPLMVLASLGMSSMGIGKAQFMDLMFTPMEVAAVMLTVVLVIILALNGETNWFEGVLLLALYAILAIAFFYIPREATTAVQSGQ